jgi:CxxC motif-containing protein (DUF1111 family)
LFSGVARAGKAWELSDPPAGGCAARAPAGPEWSSQSSRRGKMGRKLLVLTVLFTLLWTPAAAQVATDPTSATAAPNATVSTSAAAAPATGFVAKDTGVRGGAPGAGGLIDGYTTAQMAVFNAGLEEFEGEEGLADGLGPRFNLNSCAGCHAQPTIGGSSPAVNPQVSVATLWGANNDVPPFVKLDGPVREVRFQYKPDGSRDGGVHALFVVTGRTDIPPTAPPNANCKIMQEDFQAQTGNMIFRIPTPVFGGGLIEQIPDSAILANQASDASQKASLGIRGRPSRVRIDEGTVNLNGNDGTIARFGWKAQNKSLLLFSGEAYNVEMGISNELFPTERDETASCQYAPTPNDTTNLDGTTPDMSLSGIEKFAFFMRLLAPPEPSPDTPGGAPSIKSGRALFRKVGCALCHTPTLSTGYAAIGALSNKDVNLFSDLLLHKMGAGLADDIIQGQAGPDEFRTAPLWGLGQRIFFLHDGRTTDLIEAIRAHASQATATFVASEANAVVDNFNQLDEGQKQDLLNFLRAL